MSIVTVSDIRIPGSTGYRELKARLIDLMKQGMQPRQLALALTLGITIGLLPTLWGTSLLCFLLAWLFRLNLLVVQLANFLVYPFQILLFIPYFQLGDILFCSNNLPENQDMFLQVLQTAPLRLLELYWQANLQAILAWLISTPLILLCSFPMLLLLTKKLRLDQPEETKRHYAEN